MAMTLERALDHVQVVITSSYRPGWVQNREAWNVIRAHLSRPAQAVDVDALAQEIRRVDGNHSLGAGALAEALMPFITRARDWAELSGRNERRADLAESRLAAANALLREIYDYGENMDLHERIKAHLQGAGDELS